MRTVNAQCEICGLVISLPSLARGTTTDGKPTYSRRDHVRIGQALEGHLVDAHQLTVSPRGAGAYSLETAVLLQPYAAEVTE